MSDLHAAIETCLDRLSKAQPLYAKRDQYQEHEFIIELQQIFSSEEGEKSFVFFQVGSTRSCEVDWADGLFVSMNFLGVRPVFFWGDGDYTDPASLRSEFLLVLRKAYVESINRMGEGLFFSCCSIFFTGKNGWALSLLRFICEQCHAAKELWFGLDVIQTMQNELVQEKAQLSSNAN